jgi:hypothetical protein
MDEAEWQDVLRSKTKIPSELARIKVSRYGFHQLNKQSPSLGSRLRSQRSLRISNITRRANYATNITNEIAMIREANRLIEFYSDPYHQYRIHKKNDETIKQLDMVIHSLKMFGIINKTAKYDSLLEDLQRIRKEISFEGGKRKTRKQKHKTR